MGLYRSYVLPRLIDLACGAEPVSEQRSRVVPHAEGRVLEIGFGSGLNLPWYDASKVEHLYGLEPEAGMWRQARRRLEAVEFPVEPLALEGEEIPLDAASIDTVVVTYTLCTIPEVDRALEGMRRVLRPGGRLLFSEHGRAPDEDVSRWQRRVEPLWKRLAGGCHLSRDVPRLLEGAGFAVEELETGYLRDTPRIAAFQYRGRARPR